MKIVVDGRRTPASGFGGEAQCRRPGSNLTHLVAGSAPALATRTEASAAM
jgi:hypothetical protein